MSWDIAPTAISSIKYTFFFFFLLNSWVRISTCQELQYFTGFRAITLACKFFRLSTIFMEIQVFLISYTRVVLSARELLFKYKVAN